MPTATERLAQAYQNIKNITGLEFDEKDRDQVAKALGQIYINGHNLWRSIKSWGRIESVRESRILEVSAELDRVQMKNNASFISIMKPDDPYAMPRIIPPNTEKKAEAAEKYEENFRKNHRKNIRSLRKELASYKAPSKFTDPRNYFDGKLLKWGGNFKNTDSYIRELGNRPTNAAYMCNAVLLGRGYTMEELLSNSEEVREAKKSVGREMEELMYGKSSPEEKEQQFREMLEESQAGLEKLRMKPVDYSDDSTLDNAKYNMMISTMVTNLCQVIQSAKNVIKSPWLEEREKEIITLRNFTDGITNVEINRIKEIKDVSHLADSMIYQLLIDRTGTDYDAYRTSPIGMAKNNCPVGLRLQEAMENTSGIMNPKLADDRYLTAYHEFAKTKNPEAYKKLLNDYVKNNDTIFREAEKNIKIAALGKAILPEKDLYEDTAWFDGIPGMTTTDYIEGLKNAFKRGHGNTSQLERTPTLRGLFLAYGAYEAEKNGQNISLQEFFTNKELQKETGKKAYEFFTNHPIPGKTEEETRENTKAFGRVIAALNRKLQDTEVPDFDYQNPEKTAGMYEYLLKFQTLMIDSHQLNSLVSKELWDVFLEEQGGAEKYQETLNQINIAKVFVNAEQRVQVGHPLEKKNFREIFQRTKVLQENCTGTYVLKTEGKKYLGKKIGEYPTDTQIAKYLTIITDTASATIKNRMDEIAETKEGRKQLVEYAVSFGEKDPAGLGQIIKEEVDKISEWEKMGNGMKRQAEAEKAAQEKAPEAEPKQPQEKAPETEPKQPQEKAPEAEPEQPQEKASEAEPEQPQEEAPEAEPEQPQEKVAEESDSTTHNWFAESTPEQWKARLERLYAEVDSHDPALLRSSAEYKAVKAGLREAANAVDDKERFNELMDGIFQSAGDYITGKEHSQVGKHYGAERLEVIRNLRNSLAGGAEDSLSPEKIGKLFGTGSTPKEMQESGLSRIGLYMRDINIGLNQKYDKEQAVADRDLIERVLQEKGKNKVTLDKLREKLARKDAEIEKMSKISLRKTFYEDVLSMTSLRVGMNAKEAGWYRLAVAYQQMVQEDPSKEVQELADRDRVHQALTMGSLAETAMNAKVRSFAAEESQPLSQREIGAVVANAAIVDLLRNSNDAKDSAKMVKEFISDRKTAENVCEFFANSESGQKLMQQNARGNAQKYIFGSKVQRITAERGRYELAMHVLRIRGQQALNQPDPQPVKQNTVQKNNPMKNM